jgi:hypothetical protein
MSEGRSNQPPPLSYLGQQVAISSRREWKGEGGAAGESGGEKIILFRTLVERQPASNNKSATTATVAPRERRLDTG